MLNRSRLSTLALAAVLFLGLYLPVSAKESPPAWKTEFDRLCGQTATATSLPPEAVARLIEDSEKLLGKLK